MKKPTKKVLKKVVVLTEVVELAKYAYVWLTHTRGMGSNTKTDKDMLEECGIMLAGLHVKADETITLNDTTLNIVYNPYLTTCLNRVGGCAIVSPETNTVIVEDSFRRLSENGKRFVLLHELGHIKHKDVAGSLYALKRIAFLFKGKVLQMELDADDYAVETMGKEDAIKGIKELGKIGIFGLAGKFEIYLRVKAIKEK